MVLIFGIEVPYYAFWIVGALISVIIFFSLDSEKQHKGILFFKKYKI